MISRNVMNSPDEAAQRLRESAELREAETLRQHLEQQLRLEKLCASVSAALIGVRSEEFDASIAPPLREVGGFFAVEQCSLLRFEGERMRIAHGDADENRQWPAEGRTADQPGWCLEMLRSGETVRADASRLSGSAGAPMSLLCVPLRMENGVIGGLVLSSFDSERPWPELQAGQLRRIAGLFAALVARVHADTKQRSGSNREAAAEARRDAIQVIGRHERIIGQSDAIREVLAKIEQVAATDSTVMILGETGTGKELIARAIHDDSARRGRPMVKVNCAALPSALVESELFGREKGAYTGALSKQIGRFELADDSTIFLDEIGDLPLELQGKLLRVLQEGEFERLGSPRTVRVDARVIAATNRDLMKAVEEGTFREDLYYRLNVFTIPAPPLRQHPEDIPMLVWAFVRQFGESMAKAIDSIPRPVMQMLQSYHWPGNVRQLRNVIEHAMIISTDNTLRVELPRARDSAATPAATTLQEVEHNHILSVLEKTRWKVSGKGGAAEILGLKPTTLESRMEKLGIRRTQ